MFSASDAARVQVVALVRPQALKTTPARLNRYVIGKPTSNTKKYADAKPSVAWSMPIQIRGRSPNMTKVAVNARASATLNLADSTTHSKHWMRCSCQDQLRRHRPNENEMQYLFPEMNRQKNKSANHQLCWQTTSFVSKPRNWPPLGSV